MSRLDCCSLGFKLEETTMTTFPAKHISVSINRRADEIYTFVSNPQNLPQWAAGLGGSISRVGDDWIAESPMGAVKVKFADQNPFGVLDHDVTLPSGEIVNNPMRVLPNGDGSEFVFTLFRRPQMSDAEFAADMNAVEKDLQTLKAILES